MDTAIHTDSSAQITENPVSLPETPLTGGDIPNPATTQQRWNGDPMDWKSWPTGRPGPLVSEATMRHAMDTYHAYDSTRDELSRTKEKMFHVAEFSSTGGSKFNVYRRNSV